MQTGEFQVLVQAAHYRVCNIISVTNIYQSMDDEVIIDYKNHELKDGLNVEEKLEDGSYIVIGTFKFDEDNQQVTYDDCALRTFTTLSDATELKIQEFLNCCAFAAAALADIWNEGNIES